VNRRLSGAARGILAVAVCSMLLAGSIAIADRGVGDREPAASTANQLKKLKKKVTTLEKRLGAVEGDVKDIKLTPGPQGPAGPQGTAGSQGAAGQDGQPGAPGQTGLGAIFGGNLANAALLFTSLSGYGSADAAADTRGALSPNRQITLSEFGARSRVALAANNTMTFTVFVEGAPSAITCAINPLQTACSSNASVVVPARSRLSLRVQQSGTLVNDQIYWSLNAN
jgi:hypothetical protein